MARIRVPLSLKANYLRDPENFLRDIACFPLRAVRPFIRRASKIIELDEVSKTIINPFNDQLSQFDSDFTCHDNFRRYMHIDLGLVKDAVGISMCHAPYFVEREVARVGAKGVVRERVKLPFIKFDFLGRIKAKKGEEIVLAEVRELIYQLSLRLFPIYLITYDGFQCFTGDTKVALLDGRDLTLEELVQEFGEKEFWVYSFDGEKVVPALAKNARKTGSNANILNVYLDNGEIIKCTPEHLFMDREGNYVEARDLSPGTALMPYKTKRLKANLSNKSRGLKKIYQPMTKTWSYIHKLVAGKKPEGYQIHHINRNPMDNRPENLIILSAKDHLKIHKDSPSWIFLSYWAAVHSDPEMHRLMTEARGKIMKARWADPKERKKLEAVLKRAVEASRSPEACAKRSKSMMGNTNGTANVGHRHNSNTKKKISDIIRNKWKDPEYREKLMVIHRARRKQVKEDKVYHNHKVVKIKRGICQDVYDIEVPDYYNFALTSGIFVHNSTESIQTLERRGYYVGRLSIDRTATKLVVEKDISANRSSTWKLKKKSTEGQILSAVSALKDALYDDRLGIPYHEYWRKEAEGMEEDARKQKVDHRSRGSSDLFQSMSGSCFNCINNESEPVKEDKGYDEDFADDFYESVEFDDNSYYDIE